MVFDVADRYRIGAALARTVPAAPAQLVARLVGRIAGLASPDRRLLVERNLRRVVGEDLSGAELRRLVDRAFESYAEYYLQSFRLPTMSAAELDAGYSYAGFGPVEAAAARGKGVILAMPHLGGWEWAGFWVSRIGRHRVAAVVEALEPPELFDWFRAYRESLEMEIIPLGPDAGRSVMAALRQSSMVCLVSDRDIGGGGVEVEFFGERTRLPAGPAALALRTGAPLFPSVVYLEGRGVRGLARPALDTQRRGRFREDVARITQALAYELEDLIRVAPEQWHLMQPNWPSDYEALGLQTPAS